MLRTLQVFEPGCDGVFRHVEQLVRFLWQNDVHVDIAYSSRRSSAALFELIERVKTRGGFAVDMSIGPAPEPADAMACVKIIKLVRLSGYDVIHAHSSKAGALVRGIYPVIRRSALFYTPHAYYGMGGSQGISTCAFNLAERVLSGRAYTINVSRDESAFARNVLGVSKDKSCIIPNPVDCSRFVPADLPERRRSRDSFSIPQDKYLIGYASRYSPQKDPEVAYKSFLKMSEIAPNIHLLHLCKKSLLKDALEFIEANKLTEKVTFVDYTEDVRPFYRALDLFLLTSRYEAGWPFVILEAMACDLPVVTSLCPGLTDILDAKLSNCLTFAVGSITGCTEAMLGSYRAPPAVKPNHREIAIERFSIEKCFGEILKKYHFLISQKKGKTRAG